MKKLILVFLVAIAFVLTLKVAAVVLSLLLPVVLVTTVLAIPVFFVIAVGWGVTALWRGLERPAE
jgi:hypothetical protein